MNAQRPQARQQLAAPFRLSALAWPGVVVAVMTGRLGIGLPWRTSHSRSGGE